MTDIYLCITLYMYSEIDSGGKEKYIESCGKVGS